jgi:hypothetical protein
MNMSQLLDYHAAFVVCAACGRADPLPLSIPSHGGFQMQIPEGWELRRYTPGQSAVWAICPPCVEREPREAPTCIACGKPMSGHAPSCKTFLATENRE